ncbi:DnaB-like helicase C-terminal domain-containing protein, partial [Halovibrio sp. HP20-50]|uniref:DnaB-like helicase C-terminal domain-containing protein n=1 Tax=Halovibrio sp. HP20-59 TaxID=3080275 RepID=UPI00294AB91D
MGKTAVACGVALGLARNGHGVHFASMEMSSSELATRMMADLACRALGDWIPFDALIEGRTTPNQDERLSRLRAASREWPLEIDDRS